MIRSLISLLPVEKERREILEPLIAGIGDDSERPLDQWLERAPLVEVTFN